MDLLRRCSTGLVNFPIIDPPDPIVIGRSSVSVLPWSGPCPADQGYVSGWAFPFLNSFHPVHGGGMMHMGDVEQDGCIIMKTPP